MAAQDRGQIERGAQPAGPSLIKHGIAGRGQKIGMRLEFRDPLVEGDRPAAGN